METATGQTLGIVDWDASGATFSDAHKTRRYSNLRELSTTELVGEEIPFSDLFSWLNGQQGLAPDWHLEAYDAELRRALIRRVAQGQQVGAELRVLWSE